MHQQDGDLYFVAGWWLGTVTVWQRWIGAALGLVLYLLSARLTTRGLLTLWPENKKVARTVWLSATIGAALAAFAYTGGVKADLLDAVLEIGAASFPLLFIPLRSGQTSDGHRIDLEGDSLRKRKSTPLDRRRKQRDESHVTSTRQSKTADTKLSAS